MRYSSSVDRWAGSEAEWGKMVRCTFPRVKHFWFKKKLTFQNITFYFSSPLYIFVKDPDKRRCDFYRWSNFFVFQCLLTSNKISFTNRENTSRYDGAIPCFFMIRLLLSVCSHPWTLIPPLLPINHESMKASRSSQVNVPWICYYGDTGSNSLCEPVFNNFPRTYNHTPDTHIWALILLQAFQNR